MLVTLVRAKLLSLLLAALLCSAEAATAYRVRSGDTLGEIATRAGVSAAQIRSLNPKLRGNVVKLGQVILIPNRRIAARKYHVQSGQNLTNIAQKFGISLGQLLAANPAYKGGKNVWAGAVITIPARNVAARLGSPAAAPAATRPSTIRTTGIRVSSGGNWLWPVAGYHYVSSGFGEREIDGQGGMHYGVDIVAPTGTPVLAARSGRVLESRADFARGWGWTVVIQHPDGWITRYAHLSQNLVKAGELVVRGQKIGRVGNTGHSTGPHLHYGTYLRWNPKNPLSLY